MRRRSRAGRGPAPAAARRLQVGHAGPAAPGPLGGLRARPAHKHRLAHELLSSLRDSERPRAFFSFSTNLVWNLSSRGAAAWRGLPEPLLGVSVRSDAREGGARQ